MKIDTGMNYVSETSVELVNDIKVELVSDTSGISKHVCHEHVRLRLTL